MANLMYPEDEYKKEFEQEQLTKEYERQLEEEKNNGMCPMCKRVGPDQDGCPYCPGFHYCKNTLESHKNGTVNDVLPLFKMYQFDCPNCSHTNTLPELEVPDEDENALVSCECCAASFDAKYYPT